MSTDFRTFLEALAEAEGQLLVAELAELQKPVLDVVSELGDRPENWDVRYATDGPKLEAILRDCPEGSWLLTVVPSDGDLRFENLASTVKLKKMRVGVVAGRVSRSTADRSRAYYWRSPRREP